MKEEILVGVEFEVELCWSGIMCFSKDNESGFLFPLLGKESENVFYAARFVGNGMSLAGGSGE